MKLVQFDFPYPGPFGAEMAKTYNGLAESINQEPGFLWKIWTENAATGEAGGIYLFESDETAAAFARKHTERLQAFGISKVNAKVFDVNAELTAVTRGPVTPTYQKSPST